MASQIRVRIQNAISELQLQKKNSWILSDVASMLTHADELYSDLSTLYDDLYAAEELCGQIGKPRRKIEKRPEE